MPLLDHFHPPLSVRRHWESLHATWAVCLGDAITAQLPEGYFVEVQTHAGAAVEIDVATYEEGQPRAGATADASATATARAAAWAPPEPPLTMPAVFPPGFEVRVFSTESGPVLVGAVELVSPRNKDRPESRRAFATKCANYLYQGISLVIVDIVTERTANLHNETMRLMEADARFQMPAETSLYAVAYRPVRREEKEVIDVWPLSLAVGDRLPVLPLILRNELPVPVDLEATYADACRRRRLS
jgi:Protein of unknown function (DUF4058)